MTIWQCDSGGETDGLSLRDHAVLTPITLPFESTKGPRISG